MNFMNLGVVDPSNSTMAVHHQTHIGGTTTQQDSHSVSDVSHHNGQKRLHKLNETLQKSDVKIVSVYDKHSGLIWLNIVNKTTGKVVSKIPPEAIRQIVDSFVPVQGLSFDKRL